MNRTKVGLLIPLVLPLQSWTFHCERSPAAVPGCIIAACSFIATPLKLLHLETWIALRPRLSLKSISMSLCRSNGEEDSALFHLNLNVSVMPQDRRTVIMMESRRGRACKFTVVSFKQMCMHAYLAEW